MAIRVRIASAAQINPAGRRAVRFLPVLLLTAFILCLGPSAAPAEEPAFSPALGVPQEITLQLKWKHQFQFAGYYAAVEKGFFRQEGLKVRLVEAGEGQDSIKEVLDGRAEYGVATSDLLLAQAQGRPVAALAVIFQHSPQVLAVAERDGMVPLAALAGKKVALEPQSVALLALMKAQGLDVARLKLVGLGFDASSLIKGEVAAMSAYATDEPFVFKEAGLPYRLHSPLEAGVDFYGDTLFTTLREITGHPGRAARVRRAVVEGWRYALEHPDEIISIILDKYSRRHSRAHLEYEARKTRPLVLSGVVKLGSQNWERWRDMARIYAAEGLMPPGYDPHALIYRPEDDVPPAQRRGGYGEWGIPALPGELGDKLPMLIR